MNATPAPVASLNPLETAACIWEAVLSMKAYVRPAGVSDPCETPGETLARQIGATFEAIGTASVRMSAIEWTPLVDAAWIVADTDTTTGAGGQYGEAFDWEFVPDWIVANVDWSNPNAPAIRKPAPRDPWDGVDGETRRMLFAHGFTPEQAGGGCVRLELYRANGSGVIVTDIDGTDMPTATTWAVGAYPPVSGDDDGSEAMQMFYSATAKLSLTQAVGAAIAIADLCAPAPVQTVDMYGVLFTAPDDGDSIMVDTLFDVLADARRHAATLADGMPGSSARVVHVSGDLPND